MKNGKKNGNGRAILKVLTGPMISASTVNRDALRDAAAELAEADIDLLDKTAASLAAKQAHEKAIERKTKAETRLAKIRADLGVTVSST